MRPTLTLVPDCGMNLRTRRTRSALNRVDVRTKNMAAHASPSLDLQNPFGGDLLGPLGDGLRGNFHQGGQRPLGTDLLGENLQGGVVHGGQPYTISLQLSTASSLPLHRPRDEYPLMVDKPLVKRAGPAPSLRGYSSFAKWIRDSTGHYGMGAELARWCGVERQNVQRWIDGALPEGQPLRRKIAEWAQVDFEEVRAALDRDHEAKVAAKAAAKAAGKAESARPMPRRKKQPARVAR